MPAQRVRKFEQEFYRRDLDLTSTRLCDSLVRECRLTSIRGAVLVDCVFAESRLDVEDIRNLLDATVTLNCFTFRDLEMSEFSLDTFIYLMTITKGNDKKREGLLALIEPHRRRLFEKAFPVLGLT